MCEIPFNLRVFSQPDTPSELWDVALLRGIACGGKSVPGGGSVAPSVFYYVRCVTSSAFRQNRFQTSGVQIFLAWAHFWSAPNFWRGGVRIPSSFFSDNRSAVERQKCAFFCGSITLCLRITLPVWHRRLIASRWHVFDGWHNRRRDATEVRPARRRTLTLASLPSTFYCSFIEPLITSSFIRWASSPRAEREKKVLSKMVGVCGKTTGIGEETLPSLQNKQLHKKAESIPAECSQPLHHHFHFLPSASPLRLPRAETMKLTDTNIPLFLLPFHYSAPAGKGSLLTALL